jgi:hypothetical protein
MLLNFFSKLKDLYLDLLASFECTRIESKQRVTAYLTQGERR